MEPVPNAAVALVPHPTLRHRADLYRSTSTDEFGRFQLHGIPPGDYSVFAWEYVEEGIWRDPEFIRRHEASGKAIRIVDGARAKVELTSIPFAF